MGFFNDNVIGIMFQDIDEGSEKVIKLLKSRLFLAYYNELQGFSVSGDEQQQVTAAFIYNLFVHYPVDFLAAFVEFCDGLGDSAIQNVSFKRCGYSSFLVILNSLILNIRKRLYVVVVKLQAFSNVLDILRSCASVVNITDNDDNIMAPYRGLNALLSIKVGSRRPLCELLASREDFCPVIKGEKVNGREFAHLSFFGSFFDFTIGPVNVDLEVSLVYFFLSIKNFL